MAVYALTLAYKGGGYSGWQVQKNAPSVQSAVQDAVEKVFGTRLGVTGCSRTDSGVHALAYVCHIETEKDISVVLSVTACCIVLAVAMQYLSDVVVFLWKLSSASGYDHSFSGILLQGIV